VDVASFDNYSQQSMLVLLEQLAELNCDRTTLKTCNKVSSASLFPSSGRLLTTAVRD
jgi:hypothetical protein